MKKIILVCISTCFFLITSAQEKTKKLSLDEAIKFAIENSYNTKASKNDIKSAKEKVWETTTIGLPQIDAKIDYQNFLKQPVSLLPAAAFDNTGAVIKTVEDYFGLTSTGTPTPPEGFLPLTFGTKQNMSATVTLKQLLFDGSYLVGLQASKTFLKISKQANEKTALHHYHSLLPN